MVVAFRVDTSLAMGTGHLFRCLTLAEELRRGGFVSHFICREHPGNLNAMITERGFPLHVLPVEQGESSSGGAGEPAHSSWLGSDWMRDAELTKAALADDEVVDWLVVDHYALEARWEMALTEKCRRLMVIDDLADRRHECDLLLDQNLYRQPADYRPHVPSTCTVLTGTSYALLRPEFALQRASAERRRAASPVRRLLIMMGGVDRDNASGMILDALRNSRPPGIERITVVLGSSAIHARAVRDLASTMHVPTDVLTGVNDVARLMVEHDVAIGAAGSTSWERCCLQLPSIMVVLADNQAGIAYQLDAAGAAISAGNLGELKRNPSILIEALDRICGDNRLRANMQRNAGALVDGKGAERVATAMSELE